MSDWPFEYQIDSPDVNLAMCVRSGQVFRWRIRGHLHWGVIAGAAFVIEVDGNRWHVQSNANPSECRRIFGIDVDQTQLWAKILAGDFGLADALKECYGLRMITQDDPVETLFSFLCSANNHISRIEGMVNCLSEYGEVLGEWSGKTWRVFPSLDVLTCIGESELRAKGFGYRAPRISQCAKRALELGGIDWLNHLKTIPADEAMEQLQLLPGVGPKLAECVALFGLGHQSVVPIDTHMWNATTRRYFPELLGTSLTDSRRNLVRDEFRRRFGDLAGLAHQVVFVDEMRNWRLRR
ncbi:MAG: hypothetical protein KF824_13100 [Fimbriimonadaceae bacterium]|nr:MAG: hypothetical protein KF824_13100 [Fimbriimonadaceae bacterium]